MACEDTSDGGRVVCIAVRVLSDVADAALAAVPARGGYRYRERCGAWSGDVRRVLASSERDENVMRARRHASRCFADDDGPAATKQSKQSKQSKRSMPASARCANGRDARRRPMR
ncbi:hypothetical protein AQ914_27900 [Burkholderia pseudomallei]|nr:hypothetical protein AQ914_27900 [Burkholderia pseudomallei]